MKSRALTNCLQNPAEAYGNRTHPPNSILHGTTVSKSGVPNSQPTRWRTGIVTPSKVISDQYGSETVTKKDGSVVIGRLGGETEKSISVMTNPFAPDSLIEIPLSEIASRTPLPVSMMPPGLINSLNPDELADLVAYLMSGANPEDKAFKP